MIWHIFKKDFRLLWHFAAGVAVLQWLGMVMIFRGDRGIIAMSASGGFALLLQVLAGGISAPET